MAITSNKYVITKSASSDLEAAAHCQLEYVFVVWCTKYVIQFLQSGRQSYARFYSFEYPLVWSLQVAVFGNRKQVGHLYNLLSCSR